MFTVFVSLFLKVCTCPRVLTAEALKKSMKRLVGKLCSVAQATAAEKAVVRMHRFANLSQLIQSAAQPQHPGGSDDVGRCSLFAVSLPLPFPPPPCSVLYFAHYQYHFHHHRVQCFTCSHPGSSPELEPGMVHAVLQTAVGCRLRTCSTARGKRCTRHRLKTPESVQ